MKYLQNKTWFTLIELIVSITIFSIVMVSVMSIFIFSSDLSSKIEINRLMQENTKNVVETISEDIRKNGVVGVSSSVWVSCSVFSTGVDIWKKLCTNSGEYFIGKYDDIADVWLWVNPDTECIDIKDQCRLLRDDGVSIFPLTNSFITFRDIDFYVSWDDIQKVTLHFHAQPSIKKWAKIDLIKENELFFQTTISERLLDLK